MSPMFTGLRACSRIGLPALGCTATSSWRACDDLAERATLMPSPLAGRLIQKALFKHLDGCKVPLWINEPVWIVKSPCLVLFVQPEHPGMRRNPYVRSYCCCRSNVNV